MRTKRNWRVWPSESVGHAAAGAPPCGTHDQSREGHLSALQCTSPVRLSPRRLLECSPTTHLPTLTKRAPRHKPGVL